MGKDALVSNWFSSIFTGSNSDLNKAINKTGQIADFATGQGMGDITKGTTWMSNIVSGDPAKISQSLAPEISGQQGQISQAKKQVAEFGSRSGGATSAVQGMGAQARGNIINLVGGLQSGTASTLANIGGGLLSEGTGALMDQASLSQQRMENWKNSIFGGAIAGGAGIGLGKLAKMAGVV